MASRKLPSLISICITVRFASIPYIKRHVNVRPGRVGNGTQAIAWQINEETYRQTLESEGGSPNVATGPYVFYGSIHDILSYPCEVCFYLPRQCAAYRR